MHWLVVWHVISLLHIWVVVILSTLVVVVPEGLIILHIVAHASIVG